MEAISSSPLKLFQIFQSTTTFLDFVSIMYGPEGLTFEGMDPSHVCLIKANISSAEWDSYCLLRGTPGSFGVSLKQITRVLKHATGEDKLTIRYDPDAPKASFHMILDGPDRKCEVPVPLIDVTEDSLVIPEVSYGFVLSCIPKVWHSYISTFDVLDPYTVTLYPTQGKTDTLLMKGEGEMGEMTMDIRADRPIKSDDPLSAKKDLTRQTKILRSDGDTAVIPLSSCMLGQMGGFARSMMKLEVCLNDAMPALFRYTNGDSIAIDIYLAPKILDDEDDV